MLTNLSSLHASCFHQKCYRYTPECQRFKAYELAFWRWFLFYGCQYGTVTLSLFRSRRQWNELSYCRLPISSNFEIWNAISRLIQFLGIGMRLIRKYKSASRSFDCSSELIFLNISPYLPNLLRCAHIADAPSSWMPQNHPRSWLHNTHLFISLSLRQNGSSFQKSAPHFQLHFTLPRRLRGHVGKSNFSGPRGLPTCVSCTGWDHLVTWCEASLVPPASTTFHLPGPFLSCSVSLPLLCLFQNLCQIGGLVRCLVFWRWSRFKGCSGFFYLISLVIYWK